MAGYDGPIFDMDVHHTVRSDEELLPYFESEWREYATEATVYRPRSGRTMLALWTPPFAAHNPLNVYEGIDRLKLTEPLEHYGQPYDQFISDALEIYGPGRGYGVALSFDVGHFGCFTNPHFAAAVARATNNWNIDTWLSLGDERLWSEVAVAPGIPELAADEVRRVGGHPRIRSVCLGGNGQGYPIGDSRMDPIFAAAHEMGLAISWHPMVADRPTRLTTHVGGQSGSVELAALMGQGVPNYISSLIVNGTFEKFPSLKIIFRETGVLWLPGVIWQLDSVYRQLQLESPWVKRWPSEYIHDHVVVSTQPLEESPDGNERTAAVLESVDWMSDILCFATDYPHAIAYDEAQWAGKHLPKSWHRKIFCDNACDAYGIPRPPATAAPTPVAATAT
jgi:predicted TIM-barrel fold metal-dependent hydrolase